VPEPVAHVIPPAGVAPPALEIALSRALLQRVAAGELPPTLRLYVPAPTVAFGRLDALRPGYPKAVAAASAAGYEPVLRAPGGHAAAYDEGSVGFDLVVAHAEALGDPRALFRAGAGGVARALGGLGVDARVGAVAGEYCPGDFSVNARGAAKLAGLAQRAVRGASLLGAFVTVRGAAGLRAVLQPVYAALELEWEPATVGAVEEEAPGATVEAVARALAAELAPGARRAGLDDATRALAATLAGDAALRS
jgi:lipoate-protein ligase A